MVPASTDARSVDPPPDKLAQQDMDIGSDVLAESNKIDFDFEKNCKMAPWRTLDRRC